MDALPAVPPAVVNLFARTVVWDNHSCMPLRHDDETFLPQLARHRATGANFVILNASFDGMPHGTALNMLASFRSFIERHPDEFVVAGTVDEIERAKLDGRLAVAFDLEGGEAVHDHIGLVEAFYTLGVRWMLIAYNKNNKLGGGCQDDDPGLTDYGRAVIDEMERVGMVVDCSHTGYRTARDVIEYARNPVNFSHSNALAVTDHPRNIPDDLIRACAAKGGVVNVNGIGLFLGDPESGTDAFMRHLDYMVETAGSEHVGLGLDYVFDTAELDEYLRSRPEFFPADKGYSGKVGLVEPERIPVIADEMLRRGYDEETVLNVLGRNNMRVARQVWK
jgi:membrane dipeptidase